MRWNLRMTAAQQGIWKSTELRRRLAEAGMDISAGKMSALWTGAPISVRLDDLDVICAVLECTPNDVLIHEPDVVAARRPARVVDSTPQPLPSPGPRRPGVEGRHRPLPPA
jgi:DNA-binding Xre family transcriptional regulator